MGGRGVGGEPDDVIGGAQAVPVSSTASRRHSRALEQLGIVASPEEA